MSVCFSIENNCEYDVIKNVITKDFEFELTEDDKADFDIIWHNTGMHISQVKKLKSYQKYNHFPGMYQLAKKTNMGRNLMKMLKLHPDEYKFFPKTWIMPNDFGEFWKHYKNHEGQTYIVKPDMMSQGKGIYLTQNKDDINHRSNVVIQEYLDEPFLVDNLKFDIRLYVYVTSVDPLRVYLYDDGLVRFATEEYHKPTDENINNTYIHLTNYAINKKNENFVFSETDSDKGHKRSLKSFWKSLKETGIEVEVIQDEIKDIIVKTFLSVQPQLAHEYKSCMVDDVDGSSCFEILGFDIMLDEALDPYLIEINHAPAFATDSKLDLNLKTDLLRDSFRMLNMSVKRKIKYKKERNKIFQNRMVTGRKEYISQDDKDIQRKLHNITKHNFEMENKGKYELLYPLVDEKGNIVGDWNNDYWYAPKSKEIQQTVGKQESEDSTSDGSKNGSENIQTQVNSIKPEEPKTEQEKLADKYLGFINDASEQWEDFTNGFRLRNRQLHAEDDDPHKQSKDDLLNSRNPNKSKGPFQKTVRVTNKAGFGSSATRIDYPPKRLPNKLETPKRNKPMNISDNSKGRRVLYTKPQRQNGNQVLNSVLSKYISKSIVVTNEKKDQKNTYQEKGAGNPKRQGQWLPVISNPKTLKELKLRSRELQSTNSKVPLSNKNSTPKLPKVL